jgi:hypothetical protein
MYRYSVDQEVIYSPEDIVLFRESPFASWMERLTLENPTHGIPPDLDRSAPAHSPTPQHELTATLLEEGKDVIGIDCEEDEAMRRTATLAAMRHGVDFIVSGQLAVGPLSDSANLLMRTSGYSELGNYLYIPCDTQKKTTLSSAFRLCFLADLLHSLQGQLPPQMLILRGNSDVVPLQTEDHIYHYRAVKQRFMSAQSSFKKHSMPDPVDSAHFGRWSECANELLKQRALGQPDFAELQADDDWPEEIEVTRPRGSQAQASAYDLDVVGSTEPVEEIQARDIRVPEQTIGTLAEQARMLVAERSSHQTSSVVTDSLQNLEFIGSSTQPPTIGELAAVKPLNPVPPESPPSKPWAHEPSLKKESRQYSEPPPANLRNPAIIDMDVILDPGPKRDTPELKPFSNSLITSGDS